MSPATLRTGRLFHVDSFAPEPFSGNPAAVLLLPVAPDDALAARIGRELNQPATALAWPTAEAGLFGLRWFTSSSELELCGHGTLAAARVLLDAGLGVGSVIRFDTRSGRLEARGEGSWIRMHLPRLAPEPVTDPGMLSVVAQLVGRDVEAVLRNEFDLLAVLRSPTEVRAAQPDLETLQRLPVRGLIITAEGAEETPGVSSVGEPGLEDAAAGVSAAGVSAAVETVAGAGAGSEIDFVSRFFSPARGIPEDPVTGSAHCALGPYWIARLGRQPLQGRQLSARGGLVRVAEDGPMLAISGTAIVLSEGSWLAPAGPGGRFARR